MLWTLEAFFFKLHRVNATVRQQPTTILSAFYFVDYANSHNIENELLKGTKVLHFDLHILQCGVSYQAAANVEDLAACGSRKAHGGKCGG